MCVYAVQKPGRLYLGATERGGLAAGMVFFSLDGLVLEMVAWSHADLESLVGFASTCTWCI